MNICFFNSTKFLGGGEKKHLAYASGLKNRGHKVIMAVRPKSVVKEQARGYGFALLSIKLGNLSFLNPIKIYKAYSFFKEQQVEAVIFNGPNDLKLGGIAAWLAKVPIRIYWRGIAVPPSDGAFNRFLFGKVATKIIANSEDTKRSLFQKINPDIAQHKTVVIYNGINIDDFAQVNAPSSAVGRSIIIGNIGRLTEQKGQIYLIELGKLLKEAGYNFQICIAGKGEDRQRLSRAIKEAQLEKYVILEGQIDNIAKFLKKIDILAFPSLWEGFGFAIVEAMAAARPVVAFNVSSNPEIIADGETGYLVPLADMDQFFQKVKELIDNEPLRLHIGQQAQARASQLFNFERSLKHFENAILKP